MRRALTLLEALSDTTVSECTLGVLSAPLAELFTALNIAESRWTRETICRVQVSDSSLHHVNLICSGTDVYQGMAPTYRRSVDKGIFKVGIAREQLLMQEARVVDVTEKREVDFV